MGHVLSRLHIENVRIGDVVASIDENTGNAVYRKVVSVFSRQAASTLSIVHEDSLGSHEVIDTTTQHPFHAEGWDGKAETLVASQQGETASVSVAPERLFPSSARRRSGTG